MQRLSARLRVALGSGVMVALMAAAAPAQAAPAPAPGPPSPDSAAAKAGQAPSATASTASAAEMAQQDTALPIARAVAEQARAQDSDIAGVAIDAKAGVVHVYRTQTDRPLPAMIAAGVKIDVHAAKFSRNAMITVSDQVTRDATPLGDAKVAVQAVGPSVDGSGVTVAVLAGSGAAADIAHASAVLHGRYGAIIGEVTGVQRKTSNSDLFYSGWRFNDFAPWYGGDRIASSSGGCSTGFAAVQGGLPAVLTAAHCGGVGTTFYNGPRSDGTYNVMGSSVYSNSSTDVAAIRVASASRYINVGSALSPTQLYIGSWASPIVGQYLCQSGSYTGEVCGLRVVDTAQSVCVSWVLWWCNGYQGPLADVINSAGSGSYAAGHGDSGGPVYNRSAGTAIGLVHGVLTPNAQSRYPAYVSDRMWCPAPEGWQQRCSSGFSFAHMPGY